MTSKSRALICRHTPCAPLEVARSAHKLVQQMSKNPHSASPTAPRFEIALCTPDVAAAMERVVAAGATPMA